MASGTINMSFYGSKYGTDNRYEQGRIKWSSTYNTAKNQSTVTVNLQIRTVNDAGTTSDYSWGQENIHIFMEGDTSSSGTAIKTIDKTELCNLRWNWATIKTLTFTAKHKDDGSRTAYIGVSAEWKGSHDWVLTTGGRVAIKLDKINRGATISAAPNFNDEENPTITYSNKSGDSTTLLQACISLTGATDDIAYRDLPTDGTTYTFELTDAERDILRNATLDGSTKRKVRFYVKSEVAGYSYSKYLEKEFEVINCMPEIHATIYDVNENTVALTQNSDVFVFGASDLQFQVEATPKKGATITGYNTICGSKSSTLQQSTFYWVEANEVVFTATDNRGQTATLTWPFETIEYVRPTVNVEVGELTIDDAGGASATAPVKISGTFFNSTFGEEGVQNELTIALKHTGTGEEWNELPIILWGDNINGNTYWCEVDVSGLDYTQQLTFQARVSDKATSVDSAEQTTRLTPIFDWGESDFNFNVPVSFQGQQMADFVIETGTEAMGSNGTWHWQKWKSGKAECWGCRNYGNMAITESFSGMYSSPDFTQDLPGIFTEAPHVMSIDVCGTDDGFVFVMKQSRPTASDSGIFIVCRPTSKTVPQVHISFHVIGSWKEPEATTTE